MEDLLSVHRRLLEKRRHIMNLVGPGDIDEHYEDARLGLSGLEPSGVWADLGSGAGFPGIVFAAMFPTVVVDLVERRRKRCTFLEAVLLEAADVLVRRKAPVRVRCIALEELPDACYDGILARALAPPREALRAASRLLRPGGMVVLFLQGDVTPPSVEGFVLEPTRAYSVAGKNRQTVTYTRMSGTLRLDGTAEQ